MPSRRQQIFEQLGLLGDEEPTNPYRALGIDPNFARDLLREDPSGAALRFVAVGMFRTLSRRYHSDIGETGNPERFREISAAGERIGKADTAALLRWSKVEGAASSARQTKQQERREELALRAAGLVRNNMELGQHPQHFSQLGWAQGILLKRGESTLLARQRPEGGLQVLRGDITPVDRTRLLSTETQAFDFQTFMRSHGSFGLEPGTKVVTYIDTAGRASILTPALGFIMDITDPVAAYRERRAPKPRAKGKIESVDTWSRSRDPVLLISRIPEELSLGDPEAQVVNFPTRTSLQTNTGKSLAWDLPLEVAGSVSDEELFRRVRHNRAAGALALAESAGRRTTNYFGMAAIPTGQLIEQDAGYTPLLTPGNSLLLYDAHSQMPVVTNAQVVGMIGNGAQY